MKLEVGMYVRTYDGKIGKAVELNNENSTFVEIEFLDHWLLLHCLITKASHNIIDLIKEGDYVNGSKVNIIENEFIYFDTGHSIHYEYIETIVTKEQFEAMAYKVVE